MPALRRRGHRLNRHADGSSSNETKEPPHQVAECGCLYSGSTNAVEGSLSMSVAVSCVPVQGEPRKTGLTDPRFSGTPFGYLRWHPPAGGVLLRGLGNPAIFVRYSAISREYFL